MTIQQLQSYLSKLPHDMKVTVVGSPNIRLTKDDRNHTLNMTWLIISPGSYMDDSGSMGEAGQFLQRQCDGKVKWVNQ